jgi:hypothetical protein
MTHEHIGGPAKFRLAYTLNGALFYHEQVYCCVLGIPSADILPEGSVITEVSLSSAGVETCVTDGKVQITASLDDARDVIGGA